MYALLKFQEQGKIRYIGVSNFSGDEIVESIRHAELISVQPQSSVQARKIEDSIQKICVENNIAIIPYGSLGGGILTGKYDKRPEFKKQDARNFFYRFFSEKNWPKVSALSRGLRNMAAEKGEKDDTQTAHYGRLGPPGT